MEVDTASSDEAESEIDEFSFEEKGEGEGISTEQGKGERGEEEGRGVEGELEGGEAEGGWEAEVGVKNCTDEAGD